MESDYVTSAFIVGSGLHSLLLLYSFVEGQVFVVFNCLQTYYGEGRSRVTNGQSSGASICRSDVFGGPDAYF